MCNVLHNVSIKTVQSEHLSVSSINLGFLRSPRQFAAIDSEVLESLLWKQRRLQWNTILHETISFRRHFWNVRNELQIGELFGFIWSSSFSLAPGIDRSRASHGCVQTISMETKEHELAHQNHCYYNPVNGHHHSNSSFNTKTDCLRLFKLSN